MSDERQWVNPGKYNHLLIENTADVVAELRLARWQLDQLWTNYEQMHKHLRDLNNMVGQMAKTMADHCGRESQNAAVMAEGYETLDKFFQSTKDLMVDTCARVKKLEAQAKPKRRGIFGRVWGG